VTADQEIACRLASKASTALELEAAHVAMACAEHAIEMPAVGPNGGTRPLTDADHEAYGREVQR